MEKQYCEVCGKLIGEMSAEAFKKIGMVCDSEECTPFAIFENNHRYADELPEID